MVLSVASLSLMTLMIPSTPVLAQSGGFGGGHMPSGSAPSAQPPVVQISQPQPPVVHIPVIPLKPDVPRINLPLNPRDIVSTPISTIHETPVADVAKGVTALQDSKFPSFDRVSGSYDWILVKFREGSEFNKPSSYAVHLTSGQLLVSVRRPSRLALLTCDKLEVSAGADCDLLFTYDNGVVRVANLTGLNDSVKIKLKEPAAGGTGATVFSVKPGYEFIYRGDQKLSSRDVRAADGISRRHFSYLENGYAAVAEVSVESVVRDCDLVAQLDQQSTGIKEKRILSDMSKMAAVLNYVNGGDGYKNEGNVTLQVKSTLLPSKSIN